jgi:hypothetical protein
MPAPFTIIQRKEGATPARPLFLVTIVSPDGDTVWLTTAAYYGAPNITYGANTYMARILGNDIQALASMSPQGYVTVPGFNLTLADADKDLWLNHCLPHGWRGAVVTLTVVLWDVIANQYSTDAIQWSFIGGNPQHIDGKLTVDAISALNFTRLKVPSVPIQFRCPWAFPPDAVSRAAAANDITSNYYQCGYSPDIGGGVGNYASGTTPFTTCDYTRSGGPGGDPSVGCMARLGNGATTSVAPDGDLLHDKSGRATGRFGGVTWIAPTSFKGAQYTSGQTILGFNAPNASIVGSFYPWVYGTQWVQCAVLAPASDPNSTRAETIVCFAPYGAAHVIQLLVNGVIVPQSNSDQLFTWRYISQGGRNGALEGDSLFNNHSDPHGSMCAIEFVVPIQLAGSGSTPSVQALVTGPPFLSVTSGLAFAAVAPDMIDNTADPTNNLSGPAANPVFVYLDLMNWGNVVAAQVDAASFYATSLLMRPSVSYVGADGNTYTHPAFKASFALLGSQRQSLAQVLTGIRNAANLIVAPNSVTGKIQCFAKQTLADQQPAPIAGSNDATARASMPASSTTLIPSLGTPGYYAYLFDESCIEPKSFKVTSPNISAVPNTVAFGFQDESNGYQVDTLTEIDPESYLYSGNQQINVPIAMVGIPNFDQGLRQANVLLGEALYGNPRDDAGGTMYFEFTCNHRVLHLAARLGFICGLIYQPLGIGVAAPQAIRILELKPDTDGEHWQVKAAAHNDEWYTTAYGQNPTPYQNNPLLGPVLRPPYAWAGGGWAWPSTDALFPNVSSFHVVLDATSYPAQIAVFGVLPVNAQPATRGPLNPPQASTANTGGSLKPGTYFIAFSANGWIGPISPLFCTVNVPVGTNTNTITVGNVQWPGGAAAEPMPFIGTNPLKLEGQVTTYTTSGVDLHGNPTSFTITAIDEGAGLPDIAFSGFLLEEFAELVGGVWGDTITTRVGNVLTLSGGYTVNQWAGYTLSLLYRPSPAFGIQPSINASVVSNTAGTLTVSGTTSNFLAGDVVVLRAKPSTHTTTTLGDAQFVNVYTPTGLPVNAYAGAQLQIVAGTGTGYPAKTILSNTSTVFTVDGTFDVTPDATSVFIVIAATPNFTLPTGPISSDGTNYPSGSPPVTGGVVQVGTMPAITLNESSLFLRVSTIDANGNAAPPQYQPWREIFVPAQNTSPPTVNPGYFTVPLDGSNNFNIDLANGINQRIVLTTATATGTSPNVITIATIVAPIYTGGVIAAGLALVLFLDQDATGGWPAPLFNLHIPMTNPGFESGALTPGWSTSPGPATVVNLPSHGGIYSANDVTSGDEIYQDVPGLTPGATYTVEAWLLTTAGGAGHLLLHDTTGSNIVTGAASSPLDWARVSLQYTANATGAVRIHLVHDASINPIYWDDVAVYVSGGFASDVGAQSIEGTPNTRTVYQLTRHGAVWGLDQPIHTGAALS